MKKAAAYARCAQPSPRAIQRQIRRCAQIAEREGLLLDRTMIFQDNGCNSAGRLVQRTGYRRLTEELASGGVEALVVDDLSRLSRSMSQLVKILTWLDEIGVRLILADGEAHRAAHLQSEARRLGAGPK